MLSSSLTIPLLIMDSHSALISWGIPSAGGGLDLRDCFDGQHKTATNKSRTSPVARSTSRMFLVLLHIRSSDPCRCKTMKDRKSPSRDTLLAEAELFTMVVVLWTMLMLAELDGGDC